jgi:GNAT superfamily N-acetyltransferase
MVVHPLRLTCPPDRLLFRGTTSPDKHTLKLACRNNDLWLCEIYNHKLPEVNARILPCNGNTDNNNKYHYLDLIEPSILLYIDYVHTNEGYCYYTLRDGKPYIYNLTVYKNHRRKGYGRILLETIIKLIKKSYPEEDILIHPVSTEVSTEILSEFYISMGLVIYK